uniref:Uncharacterized protein n=1 Tax=Anguilla anguilla TaxID=7936 RepID=A0A0E9XQK5_ANGAN
MCIFCVFSQTWLALYIFWLIILMNSFQWSITLKLSKEMVMCAPCWHGGLQSSCSFCNVVLLHFYLISSVL